MCSPCHCRSLARAKRERAQKAEWTEFYESMLDKIDLKEELTALFVSGVRSRTGLQHIEVDREDPGDDNGS